MAKTTSNNSEKGLFAEHGTKFQEVLSFAILDESAFADQIGEVLDVNFLELKYLQIFVQKIYDYKKKYGVHPSRDMITSVLRTELKDISEVIQDQLRNYYARMLSADFLDELPYVKTTALQFCRIQKVKEALIRSVDLLDRASFDEVGKAINDALRMGADPDLGYDYIRDFEERYQLKSRGAISSGWEEIDNIISGGLGIGELGVIISTSGTGKSLLLTHLGTQAIKRGKNVVYYTLELSDKMVGQRFDACLTGISMNELMSYKDQVFTEITDQGNKLGKLLIKQYPPKIASIDTLKAHLDKLAKRDFKTSMIIVDYADLIKPTGTIREKREQLETIYEELRAIASIYGCPIWTASQSNRSSIGADVIGMEFIAESMGKVFTSDLVISLARTMNDLPANTGRLYVVKNRFGPTGYIYPIFMDAASVSIKVLPRDTRDLSTLLVDAKEQQAKSLKAKYKSYKLANKNQ